MKDNNDYSIENLGAIFAKHADIADDEHEKMIKQYIQQYSDNPLPKHLKENFNIARALSVMASEIDRLKQIIGRK